MTPRGVAGVICLCIGLLACTHQDSVFSMSPRFMGHSDNSASTVASCIASRWNSATRALSRRRSGGAVRLRAQTLFSGILIGARVREMGGKTLVEYFERRRADPLYVRMVRGCLTVKNNASPEPKKG